MVATMKGGNYQYVHLLLSVLWIAIMNLKVGRVVHDICKFGKCHDITRTFCSSMNRKISISKAALRCHTSSLSPFRSKATKHSDICGKRFLSHEKRRLPIIYLFTKEDCTLCDEAKILLQPYRHRFVLEEVDITLPENEYWYDMYKYDIPVFHMFEEFLFKHRVDLNVLEHTLKEYEKKSDIT